MIAYLLYTLKVSICLVVFYAFYSLVLRKCTFFLLNRFFLLSGVILAFIIPILKLSIFEGQSNGLFSSVVDISLIEPEYDFFQTQELSGNVNSSNISMILSVIYIAGISVLFFKLLFSLVRIFRIKNNSAVSHLGKIRIVNVESIVPFSFFNIIFLPNNKYNQLIIEHEIAHIEQLHWFDLILVETASVLLWFNPFVFLYKSSIKLQHEYLADSQVIRNSNEVHNYLDCMLQHVQVVSSGGLVSHFYCKTIKKRIIMITKNKTSIHYSGVYLLTIPLVCFLLFAFAADNHKNVLIPKGNTVIVADEFQPSGYPVNEKKITRTNGYGERINPLTKEKDFHYAIDFAVPEGEKIVSTAKGIVAETDFDLKRGNYILIQHNEVYSTFYSHLKTVSVIAGDKVEKGQEIGFSGNTGLSTGPHLHYEVYKNGERVDPKDYLEK